MTTEHPPSWYQHEAAVHGYGGGASHHPDMRGPPQAAVHPPHSSGPLQAHMGAGGGSVGAFQERVLVPRKYIKSPAPHEDDEDDEESVSSSSKGSKGGQGGGADKRGNYKCGRCGQPKKGHVCTNKPRIKTAVVETREEWAQAEMDHQLTVRQLDTTRQGYHDSYGLASWSTTPAMMASPMYGGGSAYPAMPSMTTPSYPPMPPNQLPPQHHYAYPPRTQQHQWAQPTHDAARAHQQQTGQQHYY